MSKVTPAIERLHLFSYRTKEMSDLRLVRSGMEMRFSIRWDYISQFLRYQMPKIDEEDLRSFLLSFRQFISKGEPVFIERIFNDCERYLKDDLFKEQVRKARKEWSNVFHNTGPISVKINEKNLTGDYVLDLYINGYYFHNDSNKASELHRLLGNFIPMLRVKFLEVLPSLTQIILYMGGVVDYALDQNLFAISESPN